MSPSRKLVRLLLSVTIIVSVCAFPFASPSEAHSAGTQSFSTSTGLGALLCPPVQNVTASSSLSNYGGELFSSAYAFGCISDQYWNAGASTAWVQAQYSTPQTFSGVIFETTANPYAPTEETYTISGSNDGQTWTILATSSQSISQSAGIWITPIVFNQVTFSYLLINANSGNSWAALGDVELYPTEASSATATADVAVGVAAIPNPVAVGSTLTYMYDVYDFGPMAATGVELKDRLPANVTLVSATSPQGSCSGTVTVVCTIGNVPFNSSVAAATIVVVPTAAGTIINTVSVSGNQTDPDLANNTASLNTQVTPSVAYQVGLQASTTSPQSNQSVTLVATANQDVGSPDVIQIYNTITGKVLASCKLGPICTDEVPITGSATTQNYAARISLSNGTSVQAVSPPVIVNWGAGGRELNAISWALQQYGSTAYDPPVQKFQECEVFIEDAFNAPNTTYHHFGTAYVDYTSMLAQGQIHAGDTNVPGGALAFFGQSALNGNAGHVMLSIGSGDFMSSSVIPGSTVTNTLGLTETGGVVGYTTISLVTQDSGPYLGWSWADSSWLGQ